MACSGEVCASTLSLMDAGVPISAPVAGIAMGLVTDDSGRSVVLTDIQGLEDFLGDMDFKVAGTQNGITGIQLDLKINGISVEVERGTSVLDAARFLGIPIPTLCHDDGLTPYGACRLCVVEIAGMRGYPLACSTTVPPAVLGPCLPADAADLEAFLAERRGRRVRLLVPERGEKRRLVRVAFRDTGPGIAAEHLQKLFLPFFTTKENGTGLGLSITHNIIQAHGGIITAESQVNQGTAFHIHLPSLEKTL